MVTHSSLFLHAHFEKLKSSRKLRDKGLTYIFHDKGSIAETSRVHVINYLLSMIFCHVITWDSVLKYYAIIHAEP